jgi:quinohemoprotein amine dehydrogenase
MSRVCFARVAGVALLGLMLVPGAAVAQRGGGPGGGRGGPPADTTKGFAIANREILNNCTGCHKRDTAGYVQRISYERKTPEGWEMSIRRMVGLHKLDIDPATARTIVRYLSDNQGLAPAEMRPARFEPERRLIEYRYTADPRTETTCRACHSMGRVLTQRRTRDEWNLLIATHRALYPDGDFQAFRRGGAAQNDSGVPIPHPMDAAVGHLARAFPLRTQDWVSWSATMRPPHLEGTWLLTGNEPGRGTFFGTLTVSPGATPGEFVTQANYRYADGGGAVRRTGKSIVYTGYQWRGRSTDPAQRARDTVGLREVMFVEPGWNEMSGRWFTGGYDELGMDVTLKKAGNGTVIAGVAPRAIRVGGPQDVTIFGANLPASPGANAIDFGPGVTVSQVVRSSADSITVRVTVDSGATPGRRDLFAGGASLREAAIVYDAIDRLVVTPLAGMARAGGVVFPKQLQQFDAIAWWNGPDGKSGTEDDLEIGRVKPRWSLEEYGVTYDDDDIKFVGTLDQNGLFTPNVDGPNPQRSSSRNNIGDVWVVANWTPPGKNAKNLRARAHLVVVPPLYVRFVPWKYQP